MSGGRGEGGEMDEELKRVIQRKQRERFNAERETYVARLRAFNEARRRRATQRNLIGLVLLGGFSIGSYTYLRLLVRRNSVQNVLEDMEPLPPEEDETAV